MTDETVRNTEADVLRIIPVRRDGETDDTKAIERAIDEVASLNNKGSASASVCFPVRQGGYILARECLVASPITLRGAA